MTERVGRNDLCPCGSGKKYKKCHGLLNETNVDQLIDEELEQVISRFYMMFPTPGHVKANTQLFVEWDRRLSPYYDQETIHSQAIDYLYMIQAPQYWQSYISKCQEKAERPSVQEALSGWVQPLSILGVVDSIDHGIAKFRDVLGSGDYTLQVPKDMELSRGEAFFGHFLKDVRVDGRLTLMNGLAFLESGNPEVLEAVEHLLSKKAHLSQSDFFKLYTLDLYEMIGRDEPVKRVEDAGEKDSAESGSAVLKLVGQFLSDNGIESSGLEEKTERFLENVNPKARKPEGVAAGAIRFGQMTGVLDSLTIPKAKIAQQFDVSPSTVQKYADDMAKFHHDAVKA